jgi:hypothetical protein
VTTLDGLPLAFFTLFVYLARFVPEAGKQHVSFFFFRSFSLGQATYQGSL